MRQPRRTSTMHLSKAIGGVLLTATILYGCGKQPTAAPPTPATDAPAAEAPPPRASSANDPERKARLSLALAVIKREKQVRDASWLNETPASLLAGVIDDGTRRDGYAESLCQVLAQNGVFGGIVRVMDVGAATRNEWRELGRADCPQDGPIEWVDFTNGVK